MQTTNTSNITIQISLNVPIEKAWDYWTNPKHITNWYFASDDWHAPHAENDVQPGGTFKTTMAAKDGSFGFDVSGKYTSVEEYRTLEFVLDDGRKVKINFEPDGENIRVIESFEAESTNSLELQKTGWQAILDNFKKYAEAV